MGLDKTKELSSERRITANVKSSEDVKDDHSCTNSQNIKGFNDDDSVDDLNVEAVHEDYEADCDEDELSNSVGEFAEHSARVDDVVEVPDGLFFFDSASHDERLEKEVNVFEVLEKLDHLEISDDAEAFYSNSEDVSSRIVHIKNHEKGEHWQDGGETRESVGREESQRKGDFGGVDHSLHDP